jgi:hypothetical protein
LRDVLGEEADELDRAADVLRNQLLTPAEQLLKTFEEIRKLEAIRAFGDDTEKFIVRALEQAKLEFANAEASLIKTSQLQDRQSFVEGKQRGSIGDLANRIAGLDAAIGQRQQARPEDIERNKILASVDAKIQTLIDEEKKDEDVIIRLAQVGLP